MSTEILEAPKGFKFGCDPEMFVKDEAGRFVSACGLIPGTKEEPFKVDKGAVQVDGMAAEFNIDPAESFQEFEDNVKTVMAQLKKFLPSGYTLNAVPAVVFDEDVWDSAPDEAKILGCTPDFNAWTSDVNPAPRAVKNPRLRTASGHLHIGWTEGAKLQDLQHLATCEQLVQQLDWYLGFWSLSKDKDSTRRDLYGKAGAMRYKPYGVEYRVLSNFWLKSVHTRKQMWNLMVKAIQGMSQERKFAPVVYASSNMSLIKSINASETSDNDLRTIFTSLTVDKDKEVPLSAAACGETTNSTLEQLIQAMGLNDWR